jgi:hypothetical protein
LTVNDDEVFCREAYTNTEGLLAYLENVGALSARWMNELAGI